MTPFENLSVGSWVAIVAVEQSQPIIQQIGSMMSVRQQDAHPWEVVDGRPYQIHAVSLPFMAFYCPVNKHVFPVDFRRCEVKLLDQSYVNVFKTATIDQWGLHPAIKPKDHFADGPSNIGPEPNAQNVQGGKALLACPRCGSPMTRLLTDSFLCARCGTEPDAESING